MCLIAALMRQRSDRVLGFPPHGPLFTVRWARLHRQSLVLTTAPRPELWHGQGYRSTLSAFLNICSTFKFCGLVGTLPSRSEPAVCHVGEIDTSSVAFHNDLILSKCAVECKIVLWRIEGFDSSAPVPPSDAAPSTHVFRETRSAFDGGYQRLLQFETVDTTPFYMRFSLFSQPFKAPILVIGNEKSKVFFWDLQWLETWTEKDDVRPRFPAKKNSKQPSVGNREASVASTMSSSVHPGSNDSQSSGGSGFPRSKERYGVEDPFKAIKPHKSLTVPKIEFAARGAAWSVGGEWLLVVGDQGMIATFHR